MTVLDCDASAEVYHFNPSQSDGSCHVKWKKVLLIIHFWTFLLSLLFFCEVLDHLNIYLNETILGLFLHMTHEHL